MKKQAFNEISLNACFSSECHSHFQSHAPFVGVGVVEICETTHIVNLYQLEYVVYANSAFHVWFLSVHAHGVLFIGTVWLEVAREIEKVVVCIARFGRVVLVGELSPEHVKTDTFSPFKFL